MIVLIAPQFSTMGDVLLNVMSRRSVVALLIVGLVAGVTACDASRSGAMNEKSIDGNKPSTDLPGLVSSSPVPLRSGEVDLNPKLPIASTDRIIMEPISGAGSVTTKAFSVGAEKFTVRAACLNGLNIEVSVDGQSIEVPCDGNARRIHVATDAGKEQVKVSAKDDQKWSIAVVVTDDFSVVNPANTGLNA